MKIVTIQSIEVTNNSSCYNQVCGARNADNKCYTHTYWPEAVLALIMDLVGDFTGYFLFSV